MLECALFLAGRGHDVHVLANEWDDEPAGSIHYHRVAVRTFPKFLAPRSYFQNASRLLNAGKFDAIGTFGCVCPLGGVEWVQSVHRAWLERSRLFRKRFSRPWWKQRLNPAHPAILRLEAQHFRPGNYRKLIALTPDVKNDLMRLYGLPAEDIVLLPNGFSPAEFNPQRRSELRPGVRRELGYADTDRVIALVANEWDRKGLIPLLHAIKKLDDPRVRLLAVGRANPSSYFAEIARLGMTDHVKFPGSTSDVARYYAAADAFALPTQYEAWGMVVVEALASGLPVVTSRIAGAAVAVREGNTGELLDDPADAAEISRKLRLVLQDNYVAAAGGHEQISASVSDYSWTRVLTRYEQILMENCNAPAASGARATAR